MHYTNRQKMLKIRINIENTMQQYSKTSQRIKKKHKEVEQICKFIFYMKLWDIFQIMDMHNLLVIQYQQIKKQQYFREQVSKSMQLLGQYKYKQNQDIQTEINIKGYNYKNYQFNKITLNKKSIAKINLRMRTEIPQYPPKVIVHSPGIGQKNPPSYNLGEPKFYQPYQSNRNLNINGNKSLGYSTNAGEDWTQNDYQNVRRVPEEISSLRQTFDVRSHAGLQNILSKYQYQNQQSIRSPQKVDINLRQTFNGRPKMFQSYQPGSSLSIPASPIQNRFQMNQTLNQRQKQKEREAKLLRSPVKSENYQFSRIREQLDQLQANNKNNKMGQQIRKLKEDRRKRLQGNFTTSNLNSPNFSSNINLNSKQFTQSSYRVDKQRQKEKEKLEKQLQKQSELLQSFKRKKLDQFYSPKYERIETLQTLEQSKTMPLKNINLSNFKTTGLTKAASTNYGVKGSQKEKQQQIYKASSLSNNSSGIESYEGNKSPLLKTQGNTILTTGLTSSLNIINSPTVSNKSNQRKVEKEKQRQKLETVDYTSNMKFSTPSRKMSNFVSQNSTLTSSGNGNIMKSGISINDFSIDKNSLGEGKFGVVHRAIHKATGAIFALKKVPKQTIKRLNMVNQFILQLKLQTYLHHQNILTLYHFFDDTTHIYLLLQYMEQGTLYSKLRKQKNKSLPEKEVAVKIRQIASAVKYLHENEIAHRDIKPENIVITNNVCKLCDFGWATICDERRRTCCGTFDYTPPEIFQGEEYDYTVDLWCLGVLTYQLIVGKVPFYHIRRQETKKRILNVQNGMINYPENMSKNAVSFIDSLLKKDPKQRLSSEELLSHPFLKKTEQQ